MCSTSETASAKRDTSLSVSTPIGEASVKQPEREHEPDHDGVDGRSPLVRPVDVVEPEPESELVQRECRAGAEHGCEQKSREAVGSVRDEEQTADQQHQDPGHEVVDVNAARRGTAPAPYAGERACRARAGEREHEREQADEERLTAGLYTCTS